MGVLTGPFGHYWYFFLDKWYPVATRRNVLKKVLLDAVIASPIFNVLFIFVAHTLDGKALAETYRIFKDKFVLIYCYDTAIWPASQLSKSPIISYAMSVSLLMLSFSSPKKKVNFFYVSDTYRLLYVNVMSVFWNAILCYLLFNDSETGEQKSEEDDKRTAIAACDESAPASDTKSNEKRE